MEKEWYVVNTYSGHESKVKEKLEMRAESMGFQDNIFRIIIPEETVKEQQKDGSFKEKKKKMFPGYILVEMIMTDEAWYIVRNTPGVTGFIGSSGKGAKPTPLPPQEIDKILDELEKAKYVVSEIKKGEKKRNPAPPFTTSTMQQEASRKLNFALRKTMQVAQRII